jgi:hypothetical protein
LEFGILSALGFGVRRDRERITRSLDCLTRGLIPYVEQEMKLALGEKWVEAARSSFRDDRGRPAAADAPIRWDAHALLTVMWDQWNRVFRNRLDLPERSLVSELRSYRNRWAHQGEFDFDDAYRFLDSIERLLKAIDSPEAFSVARDKHDMMRTRYGEEARSAYKKAQVNRRKMKDFVVYAVCCASIDFVIFDFFGKSAWFFALFVVFVFAYLAYQRLVTPLQIYFGPHECEGCGKIIYGEKCPYCEAAPTLTSMKIFSSTTSRDEIESESEESLVASERF